MQLRQIPAGVLSLMPTGRSQAPDTPVFRVCLSMLRVLLSGEFHMHTGPKQLRCHSDEHWPLFPSNLLPSCSLFELQCTKGNKMQKSFCTYTNGMLTTSWQIIQTKGWLLTHVYYLRTYWFPHRASENLLQSPTSQDVRFDWFSPKCNRMLTLLLLLGALPQEEYT